MNMRNMDDLNLKEAFAPMPETCHAALMKAARSVKEEENMKRASYRVAFIVAAILVATMVAAFAATQLGLTDFFNTYDTTLPDTAKTVLSATEQKTYTVGPLAITLRETLADGRIAYVTTQAKPFDGSNALITGGDFEVIPDNEANRLKVPEDTSFVDAAKQANIPLYIVSSYLTIDGKYMDVEGQEMQDILWAEDGSALLVDMLPTKPDAVPVTLVGTLTLRVREIDPATGSYIEGKDKDYQAEEKISIPVNGITAEKTYTPVGEALLAGFTVQSVKAEKTCAGVYLTATLTAGAEALREDAQLLYKFVEFRDAQGKTFPIGINLSGNLIDEGWPTVIWEAMISADTLPDALQMANVEDGSTVTLK
jgi:hypothetical protein